MKTLHYPTSSHSSSPAKDLGQSQARYLNASQGRPEEDDSIRTERYVRDQFGKLRTVEGLSFGSELNAVHRQDALTDREESMPREEVEIIEQDEVIMEDIGEWVDEDDGASKKKKNPTTKTGQRRAMDVWKARFGGRNYSQEFLYELLRHKGRGGANTASCGGCHKPDRAIYRCRECSPTRLFCKACCLAEHVQRPLHIIREWDGIKFNKVSLRSLGLRVYLGHEDGSRCIMPQINPHPLVVMHTTGLHEVSVRYCNCLEAAPRRIQLLRFGWYPATVHLPATCASMEALELFHALTLNGKLTAYNFYKTLVYLTDALGIRVPKKRYQPLLRIIRQYRHLMMLMRGGKGSQKDGVSHLKQGELALQCPACPIPSVNLPRDWKERVDQFLYRKTVSLDACFRLINLFRSNQTTDPSLHPGGAYMLEDVGDYGMHVLQHATQKDISTSGFKAIAHADSKCNTGLRATGVIAACCSRHEIVCAQSVGNLQKGERYCNADFAVCSALQDSHDLQEITFSYDIACQWIKHFKERMAQLPEHLQLPDDIQLTAAIPKGHCPGHQMVCQVEWAMGIQPGVGRTDGEAIERLWAFVRMCAASIKAMGPGSRADTLDDQFGFHNWCKLIGFGLCFLKRRAKARSQIVKQGALHADFTAHLPPEVVARWTEWVERWERDRSSCGSPYMQDEKNHDTEAKARYRIRERERQEIEAGKIPLHDTSPSGVLNAAFLIEEHQAKLRLLTDGEGTLTPIQATNIQKKRVALARRIQSFRTVQHVYMPGVRAQLQRESIARASPVEVEDQKLWLPSDFTADRRSNACLGDIASKEAEIRKGQCYDALETLRDCERALRNMSSIHTIEARRNFAADKYRRCRRALEQLEPGGPWTIELRPLRTADVMNMAGGGFDIDVLLPLGQSATEMSWVWATETGQGDDAIESCRVEWLKSRARITRWSEQFKLVTEEIRRTPISLEAKAVWWDEHGENKDDTLEPEVREGIRAYAAQQAAVMRRLVRSFETLWVVDELEDPEGADDWEKLNEDDEGGESEDETDQ
ncbi:hypothetical protein BDZ89DRAFT_1130296 [Hymenopellis radicata]|nr:hypothetical protein BDZ89DRAFT_1130296 [Hymenopellis radicata]